MQIREVALAELEGVLDLIDQYDRPLAPRPGAAALAMIFANIHQAGGIVVAAFLDASIIGTCTVDLCANLSWSGRPYAIIENVMVAPDQRGRGVGKAVLKFAQNFAQQSGCYKVVTIQLLQSVTFPRGKFIADLFFDLVEAKRVLVLPISSCFLFDHFFRSFQVIQPDGSQRQPLKNCAPKLRVYFFGLDISNQLYH